MSARKAKSASPRHAAGVPVVDEPLFPIVGIGGSAGGLEAVSALLGHLPPDPGMAFVILIHHDHRKVSALTQVLSRASSLQVTTIGGEETIERNRVYVAPPGSFVSISKRQLSADRSDGEPESLPIDHFFRMLAHDQGNRAIGVILSGSASDGVQGMAAIKEHGGITFAQDASAQFSGMPQSAAASGVVDFVLAPEAIASELVQIGRNPYLSEGSERAIKLPEDRLALVFALLRGVHDVDFTNYKPMTVERRIRRRMAMKKLDQIEEYIELLRSNPIELAQLYSDVLIRVTGFFRDADVFDAIRRDIAPALLRGREPDNPIRVWVPGCATGEEVYSLAITLLDAARDVGAHVPIQIFGTDVSDSAVERARAALYPVDIAAEVGSERLRQYFSRSDGGYRLSKAVRDCCIFARQNVTKDPPFSRLDLVSCRNLMIYFGSGLQRKVMSIFHYALRPQGYLLLGSSETVGAYGDLFSVADRKHKIFQKRAVPTRLAVPFDTIPAMQPPRPPQTRGAGDEPDLVSNLFRDADRVLLGRFSPPGVVIDERMEIQQFRGRTSPYLEPAPGQASFNILKMAKEGLLADLRAAIHSARKSDTPVRREGILMRNQPTAVNVEVIPFVTSTRDRYYLVLFEDRPTPKAIRKQTKASDKENRQSVRLERELESTREYLQSIIEEQEAMNEELRSANEEIQSSNEELQSTNEELETAKEELQSSNEELTTLNEELENRNLELAEVNNDFVNLLASVDIPIVMLDRALRIRRFNTGAQRTLNLIPADVGRPMNDLNMSLAVENLDGIVSDVIDHLEQKELLVEDRNGKKYSLRVRPYKTLENKIEGAVLVLLDRG